MTSKNKNGSYRPMERLAFCYDRYEEITRYIQMRNIYYHPMLMHVFYVPVKFFGWFSYSRCHRVQFNTNVSQDDVY